MDVEVRFRPSGRRVRVPAGTTLLDAARRAALPVASACGAGGLCGRCGMTILDAAAALPVESESEVRAKRRNRIDPTLRLACRLRLHCGLEVTATYW